MQTKSPREPIHPHVPPDMIEVVVTVDRPASHELTGFNRGEKYNLLKANTAKRKNEITDWLKAQGLADEVFRIEEPTVFNQLFITCTPNVAKQLEHAASVVSVSRNLAFRVELASFSRV